MPDQPWFKHWAKESLASSDIQTLSDHEYRVWWSLLEVASLQPDRWTVVMARKDLARMCASTPDKLGKALKTLALRRMVELEGVTRVTICNATRYQDSPEAARKRRERGKAVGQVTDKSRTRPGQIGGQVTPNVTVEERGKRKEERRVATATLPPALPESTDTGLNERMGIMMLAQPKIGRDETLYSEAYQIALDHSYDQIQTAIQETRRSKDAQGRPMAPYPSNWRRFLIADPKPVEAVEGIPVKLWNSGKAVGE